MTNTTNPQADEPVCKFDQGCHRVVACEPGCAAVPVPAPAPTDQAAEAEERVARYLFDQDWTRTIDVDAARNLLAAVLPTPADRAALLAEAIRRVEDPKERASTVGSGLGWESARDVLRRMADAVPVSGPGGAADDCGECDHSPAAHTEGEDPVSPGVCAECPDGEDTHDYLPPRGAADGNESTAGPDAHTDQADELRPLRIPDHTVNEEQGVLHAPTDRAALRERIAEALYEHDHPGWRVSLRESDTEPVYQTRAAAVLPLFAGHDSPATVPPAPADQTAPLTLVDNLIEHCPDHGCVEPEWEDGCHCEIVPLLRRVADAVPVSGPGGAADEASSYAERVNAPLSEATVNALRERLASGGVPVRTVRRRVADETRQPEPAFAPGMPCEHGCRAAANELTRETQQAPCGRSSTMPTPCSAGDHCCTGPSKAQQPAAVAQPDGEA